MRRIPFLACLLALLAFPAGAGADTELAAPDRATAVDADAGIVVWSTYDPAEHDFRLTALRGGRTETLPVAPEPEPFDADVGTDAQGRRVVVYTTCEGRELSCDVHVYSFADRRDRRAAHASRPGVDEYGATVWDGRLAWVRHVRGHRPDVVTGPLAAGGGTAALPDLPARRCGFDDLRRRCGRALYDVYELELRGATLARVVRLDTAFSDVFEVRLTDLRRPSGSVLVHDFSPGELGGKRYIGLSLDGPFVHVYTACSGDAGGCGGRSGAFRYGLASHRLELAADSRPLTGFAVDRGRTFVGVGTSGVGGRRTCTLVQGDLDEGTAGPCPVIRRDGVPRYRRVVRAKGR